MDQAVNVMDCKQETSLSAADFYDLAQLITELSGIEMDDSKLLLLNNRLQKRLKATQINSFRQYYQYLKTGRDTKEIEEMLNAVSTNETYFYRNLSHFIALRDIIEQMLQEKNRIKILCAGCSSGEEPYTLAIELSEMGLLDKDRIHISGCDLNTRVLEIAREGVYAQYRLRRVAPLLMDRYFSPLSASQFKIKAAINQFVHFFHFNLIKDNFEQDYDIILCRNVMIYFNENNQISLINKFYQSLNENSYLFIGHSETLFFIENQFNYKKIANIPVYHKTGKQVFQ